MPPFCLPSDYSPHDRPEVEGVQYVLAGFLIDDVSSIDDVSCEVTLVLVMKFQWIEPRLVSVQNANNSFFTLMRVAHCRTALHNLAFCLVLLIFHKTGRVYSAVHS